MVEDISWRLTRVGSALAPVDLDTWGIQSASLWRPPVSVRSTLFQTPGQHGVSVAGLPVFDEPQVSLVLQVKGSQASLEELTNQLMVRLAVPDLAVERSSGGLVTSAPARLISVAPGQFIPGVLAEFTVLLGIPGVSLRGAEADATFVGSGADGAIATLEGMTAPVDDALLRIKNPAAPVVEDVLSKTGIEWSGTLYGWYLYVDLGDLTAWLSQSSGQWSGGSVLTVNEYNRVPNPSFETGVGATVGSGVTLAQTTASAAVRSGTAALRGTTAATPSSTTRVEQTLDVAVSEGDWVAASIPARGNSASFRFRARIYWGAAGSSSYGAYTPVTSSAYETATVSAQAPAGATTAAVRLYVHGSASDTPPASSTFDSDEWIAGVASTQAAAEALVADYFDGDTADEAWAAYSWTGTAHASSSRRNIGQDKASAGLSYPAEGPLQLWPAPDFTPSPLGDTVSFVNFNGDPGTYDEIVIRAKPAYL